MLRSQALKRRSIHSSCCRIAADDGRTNLYRALMAGALFFLFGISESHAGQTIVVSWNPTALVTFRRGFVKGVVMGNSSEVKLDFGRTFSAARIDRR